MGRAELGPALRRRARRYPLAHVGSGPHPIRQGRRRPHRLSGGRRGPDRHPVHRHLGAPRRGGLGLPRIRPPAPPARFVRPPDPLRPSRHRALRSGPARRPAGLRHAGRGRDRGPRRGRLGTTRDRRLERRHAGRDAPGGGTSGAMRLARPVHADGEARLRRGAVRPEHRRRGDTDLDGRGRQRSRLARAQPPGRRGLRSAAPEAPAQLRPPGRDGALLPADPDVGHRRHDPEDHVSDAGDEPNGQSHRADRAQQGCGRGDRRREARRAPGPGSSDLLRGHRPHRRRDRGVPHRRANGRGPGPHAHHPAVHRHRGLHEPGRRVGRPTLA